MVLVNYCYELKKQNQYAHEVQVQLKCEAVFTLLFMFTSIVNSLQIHLHKQQARQ